jgi:hypothetical protein
VPLSEADFGGTVPLLEVDFGLKPNENRGFEIAIDLGFERF